MGRWISFLPLISKTGQASEQVWHLAQYSMESMSGCRNVQLFSFSNSFFRPDRNLRISSSSSSLLAGLGIPMATVSSSEVSMCLTFSGFSGGIVIWLKSSYGGGKGVSSPGSMWHRQSEGLAKSDGFVIFVI